MNQSTQSAFDESVDVIVVGCGYAGANAAIAASDSGASVLILEKMPDPGGISICSGGGVRIADDADAAFSYLVRTNGQTAPDNVLKALADGMTQIDQQVKAYATAVGASVAYRDAPGIYPFDGRDTFRFVMIDDIPGFDAQSDFPQAKALGTGILMFKVLWENLKQRPIDVRLNSPVSRLLTETDPATADKRIVGVSATINGSQRRIQAKRGVVLACGGFEAAPDMQRQYWQGTPVFSTSFLGNTGDGIRMAQAVGADLWHMWHFHGTYGFKPEAQPVGVRTKRLPDWFPSASGSYQDGSSTAGNTDGPRDPNDTDLFSEARAVPMPWILIDQDGRRFTNEYEPYMQDTGHRAMDRYQPEAQRFARIPAWLIGDADGLAKFPWGQPIYNGQGLAMQWSADNQTEVSNGLILKGNTLDELASKINVSSEHLQATVNRWNESCTAGNDPDYGRPQTSMMPVNHGPFYAAKMWPLVSNTWGGPVHNATQQILDPFGEPIAGLWAAGELGSVFGHLYLSGGNLAECFIGGRIAGEQASSARNSD